MRPLRRIKLAGNRSVLMRAGRGGAIYIFLRASAYRDDYCSTNCCSMAWTFDR